MTQSEWDEIDDLFDRSDWPTDKLPQNEVKKWLSDVPAECEFCNQPFTGNVFFDAAIRTSGGRIIWGLACKSCYILNGIGLGTGKGQKYNLTTKEKLEG